MLWYGWGVPDRQIHLPDSVTALLGQALGVHPSPPRAEPDVRLAESALPPDAAGALAAVVGAGHVRTGDDVRLLHSGGKSTIDLLRRRRDHPVLDAPDAVVLPADHAQVLAVLAACARHGVAVVPFGGGTSVVGGVEPARGRFAAVITLDLRRLDRLIAVDAESATATLQPGLKAPEAESLLADHGLTLGHYPQSFEHATIGGFAATRSSGQSSAGYGRFDDLVVALRVATPAGELCLGRAPASAAGPDLRQLFLGSEGAFGVITEVTVRVRPVPPTQLDEAWWFPDFGAGATALRRLAQADALPAIARLSDEAETAVNAALSGPAGAPPGGPAAAPAVPAGGTLAITGYEGTAEAVAARRSAATAILAGAGGMPLPEPAAAGWRAGRFAAPYLRDGLLDAGALVETLETATSWSALPALYAAVRAAVTGTLTGQGTPPLVLCHISHVYPTGASLYFTVVAAVAADPIAQWQATKRAAGDAITSHGATISHHHAVGTDHRGWMTAEVGDLGVAVLRAVKATVDPAGILNPGKLLPPEP
ncbi:MAG: alkyldihydroxyacetonephosphate synthase [Mycobacteriales bacterium]